MTEVAPSASNIPDAPRPFVLNVQVKCVGIGCRNFLKIPADRASGADRAPRLCDSCIAHLEADLFSAAGCPICVGSCSWLGSELRVVDKPTERVADHIAPPNASDLDPEDAPLPTRRRPLFEVADAAALLEKTFEESSVLRCGFCLDGAVEACDEEGCGKPLCSGCASDDHRCPEHA